MEATNETGKNPAGAQSRGAEGGTNLSVGLERNFSTEKAMTENELKEHSGNACEFTHSLCVVPLEYALAAIKTERESCAKICEAEKDAWAGSEYEIATKDCARSIRNQGLPKQPHAEIKYKRLRSNGVANSAALQRSPMEAEGRNES